MKWSAAVVGLLAMSAGVAVGRGETISLFHDFQIASVENPSPPGSVGLGPLGSVGGMFFPSFFFVPTDGILHITVEDIGDVGDVLQLFLDSASLGLTNPVAVGGAKNSSGAFSTPISAGMHSYIVNDQVLSWIGTASPYGGGVVPADLTPAGFFVSGTLGPSVTGVPEPGTAGLATVAAGVVLLLRRRDRNTVS